MIHKTLGEYLKELRNSYGYSQEFVASHLNIIRQTYSHYETGRIMPPVDSLYRLAELYKVPMDNLFRLATSAQIQADYNTTVNNDTSDFSVFLEHINDPKNQKAFNGLTRNEKEMLFYYQNLNHDDREDILDFMRIRYRRRTKQTRK